MEKYNENFTFTSKDYQDYFKEFIRICRQNRDDTTIVHLKSTLQQLGFLDNNFELKDNFSDYLEIGPGEGSFTYLIGILFKNVVICEINHDFAEQFRNKTTFKVLENSIVNPELKPEEIGKYDLCLCANVFYYFSKEDIKSFFNKLYPLKKSISSRIVFSFSYFDNWLKEIFNKICNKYLQELSSLFTCLKTDLNKEDIFINELNPIYIESILNEIEYIKYESYKYNIEFCLENIDEAIVFFSFYVSDGVLNHSSLLTLINSQLKDKITLNNLQGVLRKVVKTFINEEKFSFPYKLSLTETYYSV